MNYKAYVINVDSKTKRMERMRRAASEIPLTIERVRALSAEQIPVKTSFSPIFNRELSFPELSCFYSHVECWKRIDKSNHPFALILEDDVVISEQIVQLLETLERTEITFDILRLEPPNKRGKFYTDEVLEVGQFKFAHLISKATCTAAMIVSKTGAKKLLGLAQPILPIDEFLFNYYSPAFYKIKTYQIVDALVWQLDVLNLPLPEELKSSINQSVSKTKNKNKKSVLNALKKLSIKLDYLLRIKGKNLIEVTIEESEKEFLIQKERQKSCNL